MVLTTGTSIADDPLPAQAFAVVIGALEFACEAILSYSCCEKKMLIVAKVSAQGFGKDIWTIPFKNVTTISMVCTPRMHK